MATISALAKRLVRRVRYEFDQTMAAGPMSLIGWLGLASVIVILIAAVFLAATRISPTGNANGLGFFEAFWEATMRTIDAGNVGSDNGWAFRAVMLVVTIWGIFVVSSLIGLLSAGVQAQLDVLRKGRSFVLEHGHTVILNWSESIFDIIKELIVAHAKDKRFTIVILADKDKVEMEDAIASKVPRHGHVRIVCRSGDPGTLDDLAIVNLENAGSIVVVAPDNDPDAQNIKIVLALVHGPHRRKAPYQIAAEFRTAKCAEIARSIGNGEVQAVVPDDLISRIIVHSSRHVGLSAVYSELLDFEGAEFYAHAMPELAGQTFRDALFMVGPGGLIGICHADGKVELNPEMDTVIPAGALAVIVAQDRDAIGYLGAKQPQIEEAAIVGRRPAAEGAERALILGWNRRGAEIARQLSTYMAPGSVINVAASTPGFEQDIAQVSLLRESVKLENCTLDARDRTALEGVGAAAYDRTIVLSCSDSLPTQAADTQTLVTLLHLRDIAADSGKRGILVSEMTDIRNRQLAAVTRADDFVVSNRLISLMLAQAAESRFASAIFAEILDEQGSEIYMRPVENLVNIDKPIDFFTVLDAAARRGETAFGYCRPRGDPADPSGVMLNVPKADKIEYRAGDYIVVLARE